MSLIIVATLPDSPRLAGIARLPTQGAWYWVQQHLLSLRGLDELVHADTMLFILGLTYFVSVIAQTRLLEGTTFFLLRAIGA